MQGFPGFPEGKLKSVPLPEPFFTDLLPIIDDLVELKVTLHCFWLLYHKQGETRHVTLPELLADEVLMRSLRGEEALRDGLERAVARGTLLQVTIQAAGQPDEDWYLVNSERGRDAVAHMERGEWSPQGKPAPVHLQAHRPNIFGLYEQNIGLIQPLLADELLDAERTYPGEWIVDAFRIAVDNNARNWAYVRAILQRWEREGRRGDTTGTGRRQADSDYADLVRH
jgi:DNA replication protein